MTKQNTKDMREYHSSKKESLLQTLYSDLIASSKYIADAENDYTSTFKEYVTYKRTLDADKDYLGLLNSMKNDKKKRTDKLK